MTQNALTQRILLEADSHLVTRIEGFLIDRKAGGAARGTIDFYSEKLACLVQFCDSQAITRVEQITPDTLRQFLLWLESRGHNQGGIHAGYRAAKAFLRWYEYEVEPEGWKNPIRKIKQPKVVLDPLEPVSMKTVKAMVNTCTAGTYTGERDRAILLALLDTGARANELLAMDFADYEPSTGAILIRRGKGGKSRTVYIGAKSRKALRAYLKRRADENNALWATDEGDRLTYDGLRAIITRRSRLAGVEPPPLHAFRRAFALAMLRAGVDLHTLARLMGHSGIEVLARYLKLTDGDTLAAHRLGSPVDRL